MKLNYHDVKIVIDGKEYKIIDNYAYELTCTRVAGWRLWWTWNGKSTLLGGEYEFNEFAIYVNDIKICG